MKLEIEITEDEIRSAIERKIRAAIANETGGYIVEREIKEMVKKEWRITAERVVRELLSDSEPLRAKIQSAIEAKLKAQITALMKSST